MFLHTIMSLLCFSRLDNKNLQCPTMPWDSIQLPNWEIRLIGMKTGGSSEEAEQSPEAVYSLSKCLVELGGTPYSQIKFKACGKKYSRQKVQKITEAMKHVVITREGTDDGSEMIQQLKREVSVDNTEEATADSYCLPKSWSLKKIQQEFGVTNYMAQKSNELVKEKGILFPAQNQVFHCHQKQLIWFTCFMSLMKSVKLSLARRILSQ